MKDKIVITGTGRCGTTFLMLIYSYLKQGTGFGDDAEINLYRNCNSGLEKHIKSARITKQPELLRNLKKELNNDPTLKPLIKDILVPVRDYVSCALSRARFGIGANGGLTGKSKNKEEQLRYDQESLCIFIKTVAEYDLPVTFIDFKRMVNEPKYLYEKIKHTFRNEVAFEEFLHSYIKADIQQKKKK